MSDCAEWIEDMLGVVKESQNPEAVRMIEDCGAIFWGDRWKWERQRVFCAAETAAYLRSLSKIVSAVAGGGIAYGNIRSHFTKKIRPGL